VPKPPRATLRILQGRFDRAASGYNGGVGFSATRSQLAADSYIVSFDGALDLPAAGRLRQILFDVIATGARSVTVDLSAATKLDPTAAGILTLAAKALRRAGGVLRVASLPAAIEDRQRAEFARLLSAEGNGGNGGGRGGG
jgi:anti-anti-sigma regulatory factor